MNIINQENMGRNQSVMQKQKEQPIDRYDKHEKQKQNHCKTAVQNYEGESDYIIYLLTKCHKIDIFSCG